MYQSPPPLNQRPASARKRRRPSCLYPIYVGVGGFLVTGMLWESAEGLGQLLALPVIAVTFISLRWWLKGGEWPDD